MLIHTRIWSRTDSRLWTENGPPLVAPTKELRTNAWCITLDITLLCLILDKKQGEIHPESHTTRSIYQTGAFKDKCSLGHPNFLHESIYRRQRPSLYPMKLDTWYNAWYNFIMPDSEQETRWGPPWIPINGSSLRNSTTPPVWSWDWVRPVSQSVASSVVSTTLRTPN